MPSFRFEHFLGLLTMLLLKGIFQQRFLDIYLTTFFGVCKFGNTFAMSVIFFLKVLKISSIFQIFRRKLGKKFFFWDNCIWNGCVKLSLLRREYLSSAVNVLTNSVKIFHITKRDFWNSIYCAVNNKYGKGDNVSIWKVFGPVHVVACWRVQWNSAF